MKPGKRGKSGNGFGNLNKKLMDQKFAEKVVLKVDAKRRTRKIDVEISRLKQKLKTADGRQKAEIERVIRILEKARAISKKAFFEK